MIITGRVSVIIRIIDDITEESMILPIPNEQPRLPPTVQIEKSGDFSSLDDAYQRLKESLKRGDKSTYENVLQEFHTWCEVIQMQQEISEIKASRR